VGGTSVGAATGADVAGTTTVITTGGWVAAGGAAVGAAPQAVRANIRIKNSNFFISILLL
jgi:hypothetical protein